VRLDFFTLDTSQMALTIYSSVVILIVVLPGCLRTDYFLRLLLSTTVTVMLTTKVATNMNMSASKCLLFSFEVTELWIFWTEVSEMKQHQISRKSLPRESSCSVVKDRQNIAQGWRSQLSFSCKCSTELRLLNFDYMTLIYNQSLNSYSIVNAHSLSCKNTVNTLLRNNHCQYGENCKTHKCIV
jgi:hypothetical protein